MHTLTKKKIIKTLVIENFQTYINQQVWNMKNMQSYSTIAYFDKTSTTTFSKIIKVGTSFCQVGWKVKLYVFIAILVNPCNVPIF
jgi:hypothetical protein